jgi:adenosylhomocysteine nucleosidase
MTRFPADAALSDALAAAAPLALQDMLATLPQSEWLNLDLPNAQVHQGLIASGDRFVSQTVESQALQRDLPDALAVEMECAAMAQVCHDYGVPLAAVRTISDRADDAAHVDFPRFIQSIASRYSVAVLERLLSALPA